MAINKSPVINDDLTDYPEKPVEKTDAEINDYIDQLIEEISGANSEFHSDNENPSEEITHKVDPELPGNISFSFVYTISSNAVDCSS